MTEQTTSPWVVTSERSTGGMFSSLGAIFNAMGHKRIYGPYERPPFPIKIDKPTVSDLVSSWRFSDAVMFGSIYGGGILFSYMISRPFPHIG